VSRPKNDVFLRALLSEPTPYTPVWIMRQAGRYLPEYNQSRARAGSFLDLCKNPDFATEVTLQPLARFPLDAAILFSDILTIPDAMGLGLYFAEGEGPRFQHPLRDESDIRKLIAPDPATQLRYVLDAVAQIRKALVGAIPLLGFSGSPFTLACYMIEGRGGSDFHETRKMLYGRPELLHHLLKSTRAQWRISQCPDRSWCPADDFDTWGRSREAFPDFLRYIERMHSVERTGGTKFPHRLHQAEVMAGEPAQCGADALGLD
jgi:uroporphyrinogen decarboxylase